MFTNEIDGFDLNSQNEELKGLLRANNLLLKDNEFKFTKTIENLQFQLSRAQEENKQIKEKYEKTYEAQRKLEKLNNDLEDKLLRVVQKYEAEQKSLFEEITLAHSKLVETNMMMKELELEKESYRKDCNLAVNLLQCNSGEFVEHSFNSLPVDLKKRLRAYLTPEEIFKLESEGHSEQLNRESTSNSIFKLPVFQPTAAAAMMYNMQNFSQQKEKLKSKRVNVDNNNLFINQVLAKKTEKSNEYATISLFDENSPVEDSLKEFYPKISRRSSVDNTLEREESLNNGKISSSLIANILRKDADDFSKKSYKLLPYICLRCKKDIVLCDSPTQTTAHDSDENNCLKVLYAKKMLSNSSNFLRSKTIESGMSKMKTSHHQKNASADLSKLKLYDSNDSVFEPKNNVASKNILKKQDNKERIDSWADLDSVSTVI